MQVKFAALVPWLRRALPNLRCTYNTHRFEVIVLKVCLGNRHLCLWKKKKKQSRDRKNENQKGRKMEQWGTGMGKKERTAWKGGKQFHANKGWTIGELSVSPPSPSVAPLLSPLWEPGQSFSTGIKQWEGWVFFLCFFFFFADYWMLFEAFPKGWSYSEKGFLFLWCSSIIHRPFFMVWSQHWKDYLNLAAYEL